MAAMVIQVRTMPPAMQRHRDCIARTLELELELFGAVSPSVERAFESYRWWPLAMEPPSASLTPPSASTAQ